MFTSLVTVVCHVIPSCVLTWIFWYCLSLHDLPDQKLSPLGNIMNVWNSCNMRILILRPLSAYETGLKHVQQLAAVSCLPQFLKWKKHTFNLCTIYEVAWECKSSLENILNMHVVINNSAFKACVTCCERENTYKNYNKRGKHVFLTKSQWLKNDI